MVCLITFVIVVMLTDLIGIFVTSQLEDSWRTWAISLDQIFVNFLLLVMYAYVIMRLICSLNSVRIQTSKFAK